MEITRRYRVNVGTSVKGIKSYDCTVEVTANTDENTPTDESYEPIVMHKIVLAESDALVAELDKRYPAPLEEVKK